jgi:hypothetical protein
MDVKAETSPGPASSAPPIKRAILATLAVIGAFLFIATSFHGSRATGSDVASGNVSGTAAVRGSHAAQPSAQSSDAEISDQNGSGTVSFHGYACTVNCSGHRAGYDWAKQRGISNPNDCPSLMPNLHSLTEGCWAATGREGP